MTKDWAAFRVVSLTLLTLVGCELGTDTGRAPVEIRLSEAEFSLEAGATKVLQATFLGDDGEPLELNAAMTSVVWASSDTTVAGVANGAVTARRVGETEIRASFGQLESSARVIVTPGAVSFIALAPDSLVLSDSNRSERIQVVARDSHGNAVESAKIHWSSSDIAIAVVDSAGLVTARARGTATITASSGLAVRSVPVRNHQTWIRSSMPADTTQGSMMLVFHVDVDSDVDIARATVTIDGGVETNLFREQHAPSVRFHTGYSYSLAPDARLNDLNPGSYGVLIKAYDSLGVLRQQSGHRVRVVIPSRRYSVRALDTLGGSDSYGHELNEKSEVAGWSYTSAGRMQAAFWGRDGAMDLGANLTGASAAIAITEGGVVVGSMSGGCTSGARTFSWTAGQGTAPTQLDIPCSSGVKDVNESGTILINTGKLVLWNAGVSTVLRNNDAYVTGIVINNRDQAVGIHTGAMSGSALLRPDAEPVVIASGKYCYTVDLNDAGDSTYLCSYISGDIGGYRLGIQGENRQFEGVAPRMTPAGINKHRQIAGLLGGPMHSSWTSVFLWQGGTTYLIDLGTSEWMIDAVTDLNDGAVILAHGVSRVSGARRALLLTPLD